MIARKASPSPRRTSATRSSSESCARSGRFALTLFALTLVTARFLGSTVIESRVDPGLHDHLPLACSGYVCMSPDGHLRHPGRRCQACDSDLPPTQPSDLPADLRPQ